MTTKRSPTVSQGTTCTLHVETWIESLVFRWRLRRTTVIVRCHHGWITLAAWVMAFRALKRGSSRTPWTCTLVTCVLHVISPCSSVMISSFTLPNRVVGHYRHDLKEKKNILLLSSVSCEFLQMQDMIQYKQIKEIGCINSKILWKRLESALLDVITSTVNARLFCWNLKPVVVCKTRSAEGSAFVSRNLTAAFIVTNTFARKGTSNEQTFTSIISAPLA